MITILDKSFQEYLIADEIQAKVSALANQINVEFSGKEVLFLSVLDGSFMFTSDLLKKITLKNRVSFIKVKSYENTLSTGIIQEVIGLQENIENKHVIILEDIVDTGKTMDYLVDLVRDQHPASLSVVAFMYKPSAFEGKYKPNHIGFEIANDFIIGYGMDYNGYGRNLESIYQIKGSEPKPTLC